MKDLPLKGLRILAVEQYGAGPYGSMHLADLGAEVIKIESPPGGDVSRSTGPYFLGDGDSLFFQTFNLNKRSLTLDLGAFDPAEEGDQPPGHPIEAGESADHGEPVDHVVQGHRALSVRSSESRLTAGCCRASWADALRVW